MKQVPKTESVVELDMKKPSNKNLIAYNWNHFILKCCWKRYYMEETGNVDLGIAISFAYR